MDRDQVRTEVFREVLICVVHFGPPPPCVCWGSGASRRMTTRPPHICERGVRVVMRLQLLELVRGRRQAGRGHDNGGEGGAVRRAGR